MRTTPCSRPDCGLAHAAHDPVGDGQQRRPKALVPLCPWRSGSILTCRFSHPDNGAFPSVTPIGDPSTLPLGMAPQRHPCCTYWWHDLEADAEPAVPSSPIRASPLPPGGTENRTGSLIPQPSQERRTVDQLGPTRPGGLESAGWLPATSACCCRQNPPASPRPAHPDHSPAALLHPRVLQPDGRLVPSCSVAIPRASRCLELRAMPDA